VAQLSSIKVAGVASENEMTKNSAEQQKEEGKLSYFG
jgi:hypothetical protein